MKKFLFSVLAVGALVACTKSEVKYDGETEIAFAPVASTVTKANVLNAIDGTVYPENETFKVWGYWKLVGAGSGHSKFTDATSYIDAKEFKKPEGGNLWKGALKSYYWPKTGSMVFACISPADAPIFNNNFSHDVVSDNFSFAYRSPIANSKINAAETIDLMWTDATKSYDENTAANGVSVTFKHALTWITFKVLGDETTKGGNFVINKLTMNGVKAVGSFTSKNRTWGVATAYPFPVFDGAKNLTTEATVIENVDRGTLIIPQVKDSEYTATIEFTNNLGDEVIHEVVNVDLGKGWEIGKHYTYTIKFTATEILIQPEMEDWVEVDAGTTIF